MHFFINNLFLGSLENVDNIVEFLEFPNFEQLTTYFANQLYLIHEHNPKMFYKLFTSINDDPLKQPSGFTLENLNSDEL